MDVHQGKGVCLSLAFDEVDDPESRERGDDLGSKIVLNDIQSGR